MTNNRILTPDLARGSALLGIAVANAVTVWTTNINHPMPGHIGIIAHDSLWDKIAIMIGAIFVHVRGLPMFATLLGYGVGMILVREQRNGSRYRRVLTRRYATLALIGVLHMIFLFYGDIMLTYALMALTIVPLAKYKDKTLIIVTCVLYLASTAFFLQTILSPTGEDRANPYGHGYLVDQLGPGTFLVQATPIMYLLDIITVLPMVLVGFIAGRRGMLENPEPYRRLMRWCAGLAVVVSFGLGIPLGLASIGVIGGEPAWFTLNQLVGQLVGLGMIAWVFYIAQWLQRRGWDHTLPVRMLVALGRMSMTGYVLQSVLFIALVVPWGFLGLGSGSGAAAAMSVGAGVWLLTLIFAYTWSRTVSKRGPLETLHRRIGYSKTSRAAILPAAEQNPPTEGSGFLTGATS